MNLQEASERYFIRGASYQVNRYYVVSEELRRRGWSGVGDEWYVHSATSWQGPMAFVTAMNLTLLDRWYEYQVRRESMLHTWIQIKDTVTPALENFRRAVAALAESPAWQRLGKMTALSEDLTNYESAWVEWAEEMEPV